MHDYLIFLFGLSVGLLIKNMINNIMLDLINHRFNVVLVTVIKL